tara:strand:+ start:368 stop:1525 length:1158 start_codon:yes stop_codon:yes gene_type:complete
MDDATKRAIVERARAAGENPILPLVREVIQNKFRQPNVGTGVYRNAPENMPTRESVNRPVIPIQNRGNTQFQPMSVTSDDFVDPEDSQALEALKVQNRNLQREGLISPTDALGREVAVSSAQAVTLGRDQAEYNNQKREQKGLLDSLSEGMGGLLGNDTVQAFLQVLARPEFVAPMGPGQSPVTNFVNAAAADRTARAAQKKAAGESALEMFKADTDRREALQPDPSKLPKLTSEVSKLYDQLSSSQSMADIGDKIRVSLDKSFAVTGGPGVAAEGLRAIAAMFGADIEVEADKVNLRTAELKRMILEGKIFGREANKQELEILSKLVQGPGFTTNKSQILNALDSLTKQAERRSFNITNRLQAFGMPTDFTNKRPSNAGFVRNQ